MVEVITSPLWKASSITNFKTGKTNKMPRIHIQTQCSKEELEKVKEQMD